MAKVHKIELLVVNHECIPEEWIKFFLENCKHVYPRVTSVQTVEVDWDDDHPLNCRDTWNQAMRDLFEGVQ